MSMIYHVANNVFLNQYRVITNTNIQKMRPTVLSYSDEFNILVLYFNDGFQTYCTRIEDVFSDGFTIYISNFGEIVPTLGKPFYYIKTT